MELEKLVDSTGKVFWGPRIQENTLRNADGTPYQAGYDLASLRERVFHALGEVSMCWSEIPKGVFDDLKAKQIGEDLMHFIEQYTLEDALRKGVISINEVRSMMGLPPLDR